MAHAQPHRVSWSRPGEYIYARKQRSIAERFTETEVRLTLPHLESPKRKLYSIEGVADVVRDKGTVGIYDIKTHDADFIRANKNLYSQELDVYSHIWSQPVGAALITGR